MHFYGIIFFCFKIISVMKYQSRFYLILNPASLEMSSKPEEDFGLFLTSLVLEKVLIRAWGYNSVMRWRPEQHAQGSNFKLNDT